MPFFNYFGIGAALAVVGFVIAFSNVPIDRPAPVAGPIPVASLEAIGSSSPFYVQLESLVPSPEIIPAVEGVFTTAASTSSPVPSITPSAAPSRPAPQAPVTVPKPVAAAPVPVAPPATPEPSTPEEKAIAKIKAASVNIICSGNGGVVRGMSGSGVIIDPRGIIMTVAHVAQYYLLLDYPTTGSITCTVRTGSPAKPAYTARPIYVSESWIKDNTSALITNAPRGSGEGDYAFLAITGSATGTPLPSSFPYVPLGNKDLAKGETVAIAAYPAQTLTSAQVYSSLALTTATSVVRDRYTFEKTSVDAISLSGSQAAQTGSSGGGVINMSGQVVGLITTSSTEGPYASRTMQAITPGHIRRSFARDTGDSLDAFLSRSAPSALSSSFYELAASLKSTLVKSIGS